MRLRRKKSLYGYREDNVLQLIQSLKQPYEEEKYRLYSELANIQNENQNMRQEILETRDRLKHMAQGEIKGNSEDEGGN